MDVDTLERRLFYGDSEMAGRMRDFDWSTTAFGPPGSWPEPLKHSISLCLTSRFPSVIYWGAERIMLYNDPFIPFLDENKHPSCLAQPGREAWRDIWDAIDPMFDSVMSTGKATCSKTLLFCFARQLPREEVYVTLTILPMLFDSGAVGGFFCPCTEVTEKVVGARRLETLRRLGVQTPEALAVDPACQEAAEVLASNPHDIPFAAIYLVNGDSARASLKSVAGFASNPHPFPSSILLAEAPDSPWPLASALQLRRPQETSDLWAAGQRLPGGPWSDPSSRAIVLPVFDAEQEPISALVLLGVGPRRVLDDAYRTFFDLIAGHIGTAISNGRAYEAEQRRAEALSELDRAKTAELRTVLEEVLEATMALTNADFGNVQLYDSEARGLKIVAQRGFQQEFLDHFRIVQDEAAFHDRALAQHERIIVEDVLKDALFAPHLHIVAGAGYRAMRATPLLSHAGELLGVVSTYFRQPRRSSERELRLLDRYLRQAAEVIERKQAGEALRTSEERFRRYFELGLIGMATTSPTKGILDVNDELCRILGYDRNELMQKTWAELTHPDDLAADVAQFERVMAGEIDGYSLDKRWIRKDDRVIDSIIAINCLRRADGAIDFFVGLVQDITERKAAEERLRRSEASLAEGQRISHTGSWAVKLPSEEVHWSQEMFRIYGLDPLTTGLSQQLAFQLIHPADRGFVRQAFEGAVRDKSDYDIEHRALLADGRLKHLHALGHPVLNEDGEVIECVGTVADVTERKEGEASLRRTHERVEMVLASITDMFFAVDKEWRYTHFNRHAEEQLKLLGKDPAHLLGKTLWEAFPSPPTEESLRRAMSERVPVTHVHQYAPLGEWVELRAFPSPDGGLAMFVSYVTDRKHAEEKLRRKEAALLQSRRELQELTARLIESQETQSKHLARELHDVFSQRLAVIGMETARIAGLSITSPQALGAALRQLAEQISSLGKDVHQVSRQLHPAILDDLGLSAAIKSECLAFSERYRMRAEFTSDGVPGGIPEDVSLCLYRVAQESLLNIGKHAGSSDVRVTLQARHGELALSIDDAGRGFALEDTRGRRGLGLVSMEERLRIVGGTFSIRSQLGRGTHVEARVSLRRQPDDAAPPVQ
jgi:PAS domain S-box-containing protein